MTWREKLPELEGLPLLPCGAGEKWKAPIDVNTGKPLQNWQNLSFTPEQIMGMNGVVKSVGVRTGPDADNLLIVDGLSLVLSQLLELSPSLHDSSSVTDF